MRTSRWICAGLAALIVGAPTSALAQRAAGGPPDWPCVQRLIPELSWRAIWTGRSLDDVEENWWSDEEVGRLVRYASTRQTSENDAVARVAAFAQELSEDRDQRLALLFSGVFDRIGRERTRSINAIRRYARGQVRQLESIGKIVDELEDARSDEDSEQVERLEQEIFWEKRLFDSRQASLRALCEQPYLLEERLSRLVRAMGAGR